MERESFESQRVAKVLNENFISVKVTPDWIGAAAAAGAGGPTVFPPCVSAV